MEEQFDFYQLRMPSGRQMTLKVETPLTTRDREWLHRLVDLIFGYDKPLEVDTSIGAVTTL